LGVSLLKLSHQGPLLWNSAPFGKAFTKNKARGEKFKPQQPIFSVFSSEYPQEISGRVNPRPWRAFRQQTRRNGPAWCLVMGFTADD